MSNFPRLFIALLLTAATSAWEPCRAAEARPNVLMIAVDDLNDWVGYLGGNPQCRTPNIDRLAARGMLFTRSYCAAPVCNPSRAALLTGSRPSTSGVYSNSQPWRVAMPNVLTLPQHFMANGYHAAGCGKIFHGAFPEDASWNDYLRQKKDPEPTKEILASPHSHAGSIIWGELDVDDSQMSDHKMVDWTIKYLKEKHDKPFFLACGIFRPHMPWQVPQKYYDMYPLEAVQLPKVLETDLDDIPPAGREMAKPEGDHATILKTGNWQRAVQAYLASIAFTDSEIGRLLHVFDASDYAKNTIVVLWGDHGWHLGEKQHWRKFALWEEATRTPLIFVVPGMTQPGSVCERTVDLMAVYPTLSELCGLPLPKQPIDGKSIVSLLNDPKSEWSTPALTTHGRNNHAVRSERFRYIRYEDGSEELYDHDADPFEWKNLAGDAQYANVINELAAAIPDLNAPDALNMRRGVLERRKRDRSESAKE